MDPATIVDHVRREKTLVLDELNSLCDHQDKLLLRIDEIFIKIEEIKKLVHQYAPTMIAYDLRSCNDIIKELEIAIQKYRSTNVPNKSFKFSFDVRKKSANKPVNSAKTVDSSSMIIQQAFDVPGFKNRSNENLILDKPEETDGKDIVIDSMDNCQIRIYGVPSSLRLICLRNCQIYTGPIQTSVYIEKCQDCRFEIIAQQIRIHETEKCDFYFHVTSRTIIENSFNLRFGQYQWSYEQLDNDYKRAGIDPQLNNWNCIDDFNCVQNPSPNWSLIAPLK